MSLRVARGAKVQQLQDFFKARGVPAGSAEVFEIKDIVTDDLADALKGVGAIIHAASPLAGKASAQDTLNVSASPVVRERLSLLMR